MSDFRMAVGITSAYRSTRSFPKPKPSNAIARVGLRYENNVGKELARHVLPHRFVRLEHNPWFTFHDVYGSGHCSPDYLLWVDDKAIIVEVKLTWVGVAMAKLMDLYMPVVSTALGCGVMPLVVVRNTHPKAPEAKFTLAEAITSQHKLLHWPSTGHIQW